MPVARLRAQPYSLNCGTGSMGFQIIMAAFPGAGKMRTVNVPYKTQGNLLTDVMGGVADYAGVDATAVAPRVRTGKMRALAALRPTRIPALGDVPTLAKAGA